MFILHFGVMIELAPGGGVCQNRVPIVARLEPSSRASDEVGLIEPKIWCVEWDASSPSTMSGTRAVLAPMYDDVPSGTRAFEVEVRTVRSGVYDRFDVMRRPPRGFGGCYEVVRRLLQLCAATVATRSPETTSSIGTLGHGPLG